MMCSESFETIAAIDQRTGDTGDLSNELYLVDKKNTKSNTLELLCATS